MNVLLFHHKWMNNEQVVVRDQRITWLQNAKIEKKALNKFIIFDLWPLR